MKGPTRKEQELPQKLVARIDFEPKLCKVKRIIASSAATVCGPAATFDEAKASCKARKRKERQESVNSLCQERKVIRSNSEERRKCIETKSNIRRVSSSGDFPRSGSLEKINASPVKSHGSDKTMAYEDNEHEKRRSHERFARPFTLKNKKHPHKRLKVRYISKTKFKPDGTERDALSKKVTDVYKTNSSQIEPKEHETLEKNQVEYPGLHVEERARSPSPVHTPISPMLDFSTLHEQVNSSEPLLSCSAQQLSDNTETLPSLSVASNRMLSSPRNSIIAMHRIYLDKDIPQTNACLEKLPQNPVDQRMQKVHKQINSLKKKIKVYESEFETRNGYKPSHVDKLNDKTIKKLYADLNKLRKEQKQLSDMSANCPLDYGKTSKEDASLSLQETTNEIEQKLAQKREMAKRCYNIDEMTSDELVDEKIAIQKALLYLESIHGRPNSKEDRNVVRPFYDRYRVLKRLVAKISTTNMGGTELATIHENETMNFVTPNSSSNENETESEITENTQIKHNPVPNLLPSNSTDSETSDTSLSENFHSLSKSELVEQLKIVLEEKKEIRRTIKQFESNIQMRTGRMLQKEDKSPMENIYMSYKKTKAKVRLLEALVGKH